MTPFIHISPRRADRGECMTQRGLQPGRPDAGFGQQRQHHHPVGRRPRSWMTRACRIAGRNLSQAEWRQYMGDRPYRKTCPDLPAGE